MATFVPFSPTKTRLVGVMSSKQRDLEEGDSVLHLQPFQSQQSELHPSISSEFPSSHCSIASISPLPQSCQEDERILSKLIVLLTVLAAIRAISTRKTMFMFACKVVRPIILLYIYPMHYCLIFYMPETTRLSINMYIKKWGSIKYRQNIFRKINKPWYYVCLIVDDSKFRALCLKEQFFSCFQTTSHILNINNKLQVEGNMKSDKIQTARDCRVEGRSTNGCFIFPPMSFPAFHSTCERDYCESLQPSTQQRDTINNEQMQPIAPNNQQMIAINVHRLYRLLSSRQKHQQTHITDKLLWLLLGHNQSQSEKDSTLIHSYLIKASDLFEIILTIAVHRGALESIIDRFRKENLQDCIQHITTLPPSINISPKQIENLLMTIQRRQREIMVQLNLTKLGGKRSNETAKEVTHHNQLSPSTGIDVQSLQIYAGMLRSKVSDVMTLKMEWPEMCKHLTSVLSNWKMYEYDCGPKIKLLIQLLEYKDCKFRIKLQSKNEKAKVFYLLDYLCPKLSYLVTAFNALFGTKNLRDVLEEKQKQAAETAKEANEVKDIKDTKESKQNEAYNSVLRELKGELKMEENVLDKLTVDYFSELQSISKGTGSFFVKVDGFQKKPLKEFIGEIIQCQQFSFHWDDIFNLITINATKTLPPSNKQQTLEAITRLKYPDPSCLGCAQFFLLNKSIINCYNNTPVRIFPDLSFGLHRQQLLEELCLMLNSHGGVIFFSCARQYGSILPKGAYIKDDGREEKKKEVILIIEGAIKPKVDIGREVVVSFVPIVENVRKEGSDDYRLQAIEDAFVMRIKVCSKDRNINYSYQQLANKTKESYPPSQPKKSHPFRSATFGNPLNHTCKEVSEFQKLQAIDKIFSYMSLIVIKQEHTDHLLKQLQRLGKSCYIQFKFQDYGFNIAKFTAVMYHNDPFQQILELINQNPKEFTIEDKKVLIIYITDYLKIQMQEKLNNKDLENAILWLRKQFPTQGLKYYYLRKPREEKQGQQLQEYYIKAESKLSTLYMYYVFNHFKVKTVFKNPPSNEHANLEEIKQIF